MVGGASAHERRLFVGILVPSVLRPEGRKKLAYFARFSHAHASEVMALGLASAICDTELAFSDDQSSLPLQWSTFDRSLCTEEPRETEGLTHGSE